MSWGSDTACRAVQCNQWDVQSISVHELALCWLGGILCFVFYAARFTQWLRAYGLLIGIQIGSCRIICVCF